MCNLLLINGLLYFLEKVCDIWFSKEIDSFVKSIKSTNNQKIEEIKNIYNTMEEGNNMKVIGLFVSAFYNKELYNLLQEANPNPYPNPLTNQKFTKEMWKYLFNIDYPTQPMNQEQDQDQNHNHNQDQETIKYENIRKEILELFQHLVENKINIIGMTAQEYSDKIYNPI